MAFFGLLALLVLVGGSCGLAVWIATRIPFSAVAFLVAWILTPVFMLLGAALMVPVFRAMTPANNDGTWVIMIPIYGTFLGLISGIIAAIGVATRKPKAPTPDPPTV